MITVVASYQESMPPEIGLPLAALGSLVFIGILIRDAVRK